MLITMARTAESVGERDQRCAGQLTQVTSRLKKIATLEDLTEIRASIEASAAELKSSVDRMSAEGKAAMDQLRAELGQYQTRLEKVEELASRDGLTGLRNRNWVENQIERRIAAQGPLSLAIVDIDRFKQVNDEHGHMVGDEVLQQFAAELQSTCRATDLTGRWGGDEFILVMDCGLKEAQAKVERLRMWVCGSYKIQGKATPLKLSVEASIGLAERKPGESTRELLARADAAMYVYKAAARSKSAHPDTATHAVEPSGHAPEKARGIFAKR
jgi:diguanylate cyclase (GGDEF)-like protein